MGLTGKPSRVMQDQKAALFNCFFRFLREVMSTRLSVFLPGMQPSHLKIQLCFFTLDERGGGAEQMGHSKQAQRKKEVRATKELSSLVRLME